MGQPPLPASKRRFGGARVAGAAREDGMAAVAEMLFSSGGGAATPVAPAAAPVVPAAVSAAMASLPSRQAGKAIDAGLLLPAEIDPPQGLYVIVPAGIETADRRRTALAVAASLAPRGGTTAVFLLEGGAADVHVLGEPACGRLGPERYLDPADTGLAIRRLLSRCDPVAVAPLETAAGMPRGLAGRVRRTVFVAAADAESVVETYRELKAWRARGLALPAALFVVGTDGAAEAGRIVGRLRRASREFLGCNLANQGFLGAEDAILAADHPEPLRIFSRTPVGEIWPRLLGDDVENRAASSPPGRTGETASPAAPTPLADNRDSHLLSGAASQQKVYPRAAESIVPVAAALARPTAEPWPAGGRKTGGCPSFLAGEPAVAPAPDAYSVFSPWRPESREDLVAAIETQPAAILGKLLRQVIRVDVDEPDAPPLAAVRDDGALVAILLAQNGEAADTRAAAHWLAVHRRLLARAYPLAGIREGAEPSAIVLAPLEPPSGDGIRRFLPLQLGGHRGIVLLP
jgi:hypothetical protein